MIDTAPLEVPREDFDLPPEVAFFNTANMGPLPRRVRDAAEAALARRAAPWEIGPAVWFDDVERLRELAARLLGADTEGVALVPATSYGFAVAARNLHLAPWHRIIVLAEEYPSGIYTWRRLANRTGAEIHTVERDPGQSWTEAVLAALDERAGLVSVPNVHWTDGSLVDLELVATRAHELGCRFVIDASQSLGAMPISVDRLRPDFVVSVGYKWQLGPVGVGYLYVAPEHRDGEPIEENWINRAGSEDFAGLVDYVEEYQPGARRFDVGQHSSFQLVPMAIAALELLLEWEPARIAATLSQTTAAITEGAAALGLEPLPAEQRGPHMLGVRVPDAARERVLAALSEAGCYASPRGKSLRIAPHLHNTPEEVERLLGALREAAG
ncbi:MAG TPA: aminotransferase class V-fold PLP-dependent enzyme [Solirubrobacterales bacterium]|nr:aminotransferase class V-fold PLP-dependent enzyme [Solirubrobacterales bacterium]